MYGLLFQYFHLMIEGKNPLAAFHRSVGRCHGVLGTTQPPTLKILHSAWNAFTRLLDLKFSGNFQCPSLWMFVCETIICDGTLVGFRKDLLPALLQEPDPESLLITHESMHCKKNSATSLHSCLSCTHVCRSNITEKFVEQIVHK